MMVEYYPDSDMLYIRLADGASAGSEEVSPGIVIDLDEHGKVIGVEIEDASKLMDLSQLELRALPITRLTFNGEAREKDG